MGTVGYAWHFLMDGITGLEVNVWSRQRCTAGRGTEEKRKHRQQEYGSREKQEDIGDPWLETRRRRGKT